MNKLIPSICDLVSDSNAAVRDQAIETLCDVYKLVGEPMRSDILKKRLLTAQRYKTVRMIFLQEDETHSKVCRVASGR